MGTSYDIWDLVSAWGDGGEDGRGKLPTGPQPEVILDDILIDILYSLTLSKWVRELMEEFNVRALPRGPDQFAKALDSREFWNTFGLTPARARLELNLDSP